jgi:hypothetical protein
VNIVSIPKFLMSAFAALTISGCAAMGNTHSGPHGQEAGKHGSMDMQSMCEMHRKMMASKSPTEQGAMMEEQMKKMSMSQEVMEKHMQTMQEQCK